MAKKQQSERPAMSRVKIGANTTLHLDAGRINWFESFEDIFDNGRVIYREAEGGYVTEDWSDWASNKNNVYLFAIHEKVSK